MTLITIGVSNSAAERPYEEDLKDEGQVGKSLHASQTTQIPKNMQLQQHA